VLSLPDQARHRAWPFFDEVICWLEMWRESGILYVGQKIAVQINCAVPMTHLRFDVAKAMLATMLVDFAENDLDNLCRYLEHCGFDRRALDKPNDLLPPSRLQESDDTKISARTWRKFPA